MFGLSFGELVIIAVLALLLLGPDKLPEAAKTFAKGLKEFKRATEDLKDQVESELKLDDLLRDEPKIAPRPALVPPVPAAVPGPAGPPPTATTGNVPGLEAALAEPAASAAPDAGGAAAPPAPAPPAPPTPPTQNA
jgi:sec-independent protein translocase protein TatB